MAALTSQFLVRLADGVTGPGRSASALIRDTHAVALGATTALHRLISANCAGKRNHQQRPAHLAEDATNGANGNV